MEETAKNPWLEDAVKKGIILGIVHIIVGTLLYYFMPSKLTGFTYLFFIIGLNLGYCIYNGKEQRAELGGFIDFIPAFKYAFVILAVNGVIGLLFGILFLYLEPAYPQVFAESQLDTSIYWASKFGAPEAALDEMREKFDMEEIEKRFSFTGLLFSFGIGLLFYAVGGLISALFVKKSVPDTI